MLLDEFKIIFDRPEKVKKLREYILQLAVRGKLVEQDENDESASMLIDKIKKEKDILIKGKKIKKEKILLDISDEETPYKLPKGWEWQRLGNIINISSGKNLTKSKMNEEGNIPVYGGNGITGYHDDFNVDEETIVIGRVGFYCGSIHLTEERAWVTDNAFITKYPKECINREYLVWLLKGTNLKKEENATAQPVISGKKIYPIVIGIPPLNEQKRIVKKIDYLMNFCDKLEKELERKIKYGSLSAKSVLNSISNCIHYEQLEEQLKFVIENFKDLALADEAVKGLKNMILSLSIRGKLIKQDESDEVASISLESINKEKSFYKINQDEIPYELPKGWEWVKLGDYTQINPRNNIENENINSSFIPMKLIGDGFNNKHEYEVKRWADIKKGFTHFKENDVVIAKITPCFENRKSAVMKNLVNQIGAGTTELYVVRALNELVLPEYLLSIFKTEEFIKGGVATYIGTAGQQRVKKDYITNLLIPLPPIKEQRRIVNKINELMKVCDELEDKILIRKKYSKDLMESILKNNVKI